MESCEQASGRTVRCSGLNWFQDFVRVSDLDKPLEEEPIRYLRTDITVLTRTIPLEKVLTFPAIILYLNSGHTSEAFVDWPST